MSSSWCRIGRFWNSAALAIISIKPKKKQLRYSCHLFIRATLGFRLLSQRHRKQLNRGVLDVVVSTDHSHVQRGNVDFIFNGNALDLLQVIQCCFNEL